MADAEDEIKGDIKLEENAMWDPSSQVIYTYIQDDQNVCFPISTAGSLENLFITNNTNHPVSPVFETVMIRGDGENVYYVENVESLSTPQTVVMNQNTDLVPTTSAEVNATLQSVGTYYEEELCCESCAPSKKTFANKQALENHMRFYHAKEFMAGNLPKYKLVPVEPEKPQHQTQVRFVPMHKQPVAIVNNSKFSLKETDIEPDISHICQLCQKFPKGFTNYVAFTNHLKFEHLITPEELKTYLNEKSSKNIDKNRISSESH